jgi:copper chaperone CopZ
MCATERTDLGLTDANSSCACCATDTAKTSLSDTADSVTTEVLVDGMTCGHCVQSVSQEIGNIEGVSGVNVTLNAGGTSTVKVSSTSLITVDRIKAAVEEAGYVVPAPADTLPAV